MKQREIHRHSNLSSQKAESTVQTLCRQSRRRTLQRLSPMNRLRGITVPFASGYGGLLYL